MPTLVFPLKIFLLISSQVNFLFHLIQTISDVRQAYKNASTIVQQTIFESARDPQSTTAAPEGNPVDNEIGGADTATIKTTVPPPVDTNKVNQALGKLVGRNYRGLRRLFDSEFRTAIRVSMHIIIIINVDDNILFSNSVR